MMVAINCLSRHSHSIRLESLVKVLQCFSNNGEISVMLEISCYIYIYTHIHTHVYIILYIYIIAGVKALRVDRPFEDSRRYHLYPVIFIKVLLANSRFTTHTKQGRDLWKSEGGGARYESMPVIVLKDTCMVMWSTVGVLVVLGGSRGATLCAIVHTVVWICGFVLIFQGFQLLSGRETW